MTKYIALSFDFQEERDFYIVKFSTDWEKEKLRGEPATCQGRLFTALRKLETIRASERVFRADAKMSTFDTGSNCVLGVCRELDGERFLGLYNFSENLISVFLGNTLKKDLVTKQTVSTKTINLPAYGFFWSKETG